MSVKKQVNKNKTLRSFLVAYIKGHFDGFPMFGWEIADDCKVLLGNHGVLTTSEVLAKELRHAARLEEVDRSHKTVGGRTFVQYSPAGCGPGAHPRATRASPGTPLTKEDSSGQGLLIDEDDLTMPHHKRG